MKHTLLLVAALLAASAFQIQSARADEFDLFRPSLKRLDDQPRSAEDQAKVDLGRHLFYEKRISLNNSMSCNSCHDLKRYGVDGETFSKGVPGDRVGRNSPTVYNAYAHIAQFWDGRAATVEEQAKGPILAGKEMAMPNAAEVVKRLKSFPEYAPLFKAAFPRSADAVNYDHVGAAIGAFERNLATPSRWDAFLDGKKDALSTAELAGARLFVTKSCTTCHASTLVGGQAYMKLGLVNPWPNQKDQGRFDLTKAEADKMFFKVPSLRNIAETGPYFHDSSSTALGDAIKRMGKHQLGLDLTAKEVADLTAFLKSLTGPLPEAYIKPRPFPGKGGTGSLE